MERVALFEKVSFEQYAADRMKAGGFNETEKTLRAEWESIKLPVRSTSGSAGYDFFMPISHRVKCSEKPVVIHTGIRCKIKDGWVLVALPRSGMGFKYNMRLDNTAGVIDADYYNADNEGHIALKISSRYEFDIKQGDKFAQGVFLPFGITEDDVADGIRTGGFGSTGI